MTGSTHWFKVLAHLAEASRTETARGAKKIIDFSSDKFTFKAARGDHINGSPRIRVARSEEGRRLTREFSSDQLGVVSLDASHQCAAIGGERIQIFVDSCLISQFLRYLVGAKGAKVAKVGTNFFLSCNRSSNK